MADVVGLRVRSRATARVTLEVTDRLTRVLGQVTVTANGSLQDDGLKTGDFWYSATDESDGILMQSIIPVVSCNRATGVLTWAYLGPGSLQRISTRIVYGIY